MPLFHITTATAWDTARKGALYTHASLVQEGFIHLSTEAQWPRTAQRFFRGQTDLVLLVIGEDQLGAKVIYEAADGDSFPHLYGPLEVRAVREARVLREESDGTFVAQSQPARTTDSTR